MSERASWKDGRNLSHVTTWESKQMIHANPSTYGHNFHPDPRDVAKAVAVIQATLADGGGTFTRDYEPVDVTGQYAVGGRGWPSRVVTIAYETVDQLPLDAYVEAERTLPPADGSSSDDESRYGYEWVIVTRAEIERLANLFHQYVVSAPTFGDGRETFIGTWVNEGAIHFDVTDLYADREEAIAAGKRRGEIAIFDGATFEDIFL